VHLNVDISTYVFGAFNQKSPDPRCLLGRYLVTFGCFNISETNYEGAERGCLGIYKIGYKAEVEVMLVDKLSWYIFFLMAAIKAGKV
jgi:hypothetical protein